jgi:hypothetical protein
VATDAGSHGQLLPSCAIDLLDGAFFNFALLLLLSQNRPTIRETQRFCYYVPGLRSL